MNIIRLLLSLVLALHTNSGLCKKTLINNTADEVELFEPNYGKVDQEFYDAVNADTIEPLRNFCQQCAAAYTTIQQKIENLGDIEQTTVLLSMANTADYYCWWDELIHYKYNEDKPYVANNKSYFPHRIIIHQDTHNPIDHNRTARLSILWPYMHKENGMIASSIHWEKATTIFGNDAALALIRNNTNPSASRDEDDDSDPENDGAASRRISRDVPQQKQMLFSPKLVIGVTGCVLCAIGVKKLYDRYLARHIDEDEQDEATIA